ncbi:CsiV family protein [Endozoicomonas sp.]|uniref:CsiV family protein n=1 Tax=Endozoicomonas sp. TaxID=1892382 RepID=UPI00383B0A51
MRKTQLIALSVALFFNFTLSASAKENAQQSDEQWYQADLVVFRYISNDSGEAWPAVAGYKAPDNAIRLQDPTSGYENNTPLFNIAGETHQPASYHDILRDAYVSLPASEMMLNKQVATLDKKQSYQVIAQKAWRMPVGAEASGHPVQIRAAVGGQDNFLLDGTVSISEERFLQVDIDLWLNKLSPESLYSSISGQSNSNEFSSSDVLASDRGPENLIRLHADSPPLRITKNFQIKQRRRIRNTKEIQYIDSPVIGVLFKLTPYERPNTLVETGVTILD